MSAPVVIVATVLIIAASAFFVAVEFSLMAAKRHRFEDAAPHSRGGRAALRNSADLTLLLAGSQLGITVCTLALGAITKPAVHDALAPLLEGWGVPVAVADVAAFVLALVVVTFLHLVVGEMAPKSWAIAHPERSAMLLAVPMRGFMALTRPLLVALNRAADALVRRAGVEPVGELATGHDADELRRLVEHSAAAGALEASDRAAIESALELRELTLGDLVRPRRRVTALPADATVAQVQAATVETGHLRVLLLDDDAGAGGGDGGVGSVGSVVGDLSDLGAPGDVVGIVHVRDTLDLPPGSPAAPRALAPFTLPADRPLHEALTRMRRERRHLAVVTRPGEPGGWVGVVTLGDILARLFPDPAATAARDEA